ncbi:MAG: ParB/RepB/Spo0J family partition protein [Acidobacteria bacterium]|nr:ParB/RepB/Spo0J family partition protein [Acidobacteriota bacterium]NIM63196.1 ParB/RepB/Spo0J family partition protein [Acidobacteriota bacterium]NIO58417.1 ParB/RepB/Spo0J family partition protein [Acidobacteriota bacterium]NIQ29465.1 ParB/RepB/Spo0J family partition protein [Acidobacteriota bacterium]NIQ84117.1 ParB/RepB/Spo0J family partition protein [Acidobacteriota bacterium]
MKRKALGKGLRSLIREAPPTQPPARQEAGTESLTRLDIDRIVPNQAQPRKDFDETELQELAHSVSRDGVLQPVVVRPIDGDHYELIAGERRWRAAQAAGLMRVPAVIMEVSDDRMLELALIENIQRADLNPIEEATAYQTLMHDLGLTQDELAERVSKSRATIANFVRLLNLPLEVQHYVKSGELNAGHAKALAGITRADLQLELAKEIVRRNLNVRDAERLVAAARKSGSAKPAARVAKAPDPNLIAAAEKLQTAVGTKVKIIQSGKKGGGRIELHAYSSEELDRLYNLVLGAANQPI